MLYFYKCFIHLILESFTSVVPAKQPNRETLLASDPGSTARLSCGELFGERKRLIDPSSRAAPSPSLARDSCEMNLDFSALLKGAGWTGKSAALWVSFSRSWLSTPSEMGGAVT